MQYAVARWHATHSEFSFAIGHWPLATTTPQPSPPVAFATQYGFEVLEIQTLDDYDYIRRFIVTCRYYLHEEKGLLRMKKVALFAIVGCLLLGTWAFFGPCCEQDDTASLIPEDRKEYVTRVNAYHSVISRMGMYMRWKEETKSSGRVKTSNPEMFALFDKMKRINPKTGELPANGILDALNYIEQEWGSMDQQRTGYSLQWTERGPNNIGGRTRALMWDPNDATNRAAFAGGVGGGLWYNSNVTSSATSWVQVSPTFSTLRLPASP